IRSTSMYVGIALQGRKRVRVGPLELTYDSLGYRVMAGETEYDASVVTATAERPYLSIGLEIPPRLIVQTLLDLGEGGEPSARVSAPPAFVAPLDAPLSGALSRLLRALDDPAERRVLAPLAVREIVFHLLRSDAAAVLRRAAGGGDADRIGRAMAFIEQNAAQRLTVPAVARQVAMSPSHFAHRFREVASVTPMRYLKLVRLEQARDLLLADGLPVAEVADRTGYQSPSHFTRDFKRHYGLAPGRYASAFEQGSTVSDAQAGPQL
ncbi:MAG: AraC family transcriptional regulator, partial [Vicinamibacteria bacterium]